MGWDEIKFYNGKGHYKCLPANTHGAACPARVGIDTPPYEWKPTSSPQYDTPATPTPTSEEYYSPSGGQETSTPSNPH